jgi:hypothetical protein
MGHSLRDKLVVALVLMKTSRLLKYQTFLAQNLNQMRHRVPLTFICKGVKFTYIYAVVRSMVF